MNSRYLILNRFFILTLFSLAAGSVMAQNKKDDKKQQQQPADAEKGAVTEEIEVVRPYKPVLADAAKIRRSPDLNVKDKFKPKVSYMVLDKRLEQNRDIRQLQAQSLAEQPELVLKNNYVKVGAGNFNGSLAEVYLNTGKDEALQAGAYIKHLNQKGNLDAQAYSHQQAGIFGRSIQDKITLDGEITYDRLGTGFYGYDPANPAANPDPEKQRFSTFGFKGELLKRYQQNDDALNYAVKADGYILNNKTAQKENSFALLGMVNKAWHQFNIGVNGSVDFTGVKDSISSITNNIARINPYIKFQGDNYKLNIGLNFVSEFGTNSRTNLLPAVSAEFALAPEYAILFGGYSGDVMKTSLKDLADQNPYFYSTILVKNAVEKANIYGGIKGNAGSGFGYRASIAYKTIKDMPLFVNNKQYPQKFDVIYDGGDSHVLSFEGEISLQATETITWTGKLLINNYKMATEEAAWFKPDMQLSSNVKAFIGKKLTVDGEVLLNGGTSALLRVPDRHTVSIDSYVDLSGGAEYRIKDNLGVYLRVNNIFGNNYQQYLYYPKLGINFMGGFNYSF
ncbi:TonB-dependent receptor [Pedobacter sp. BS3]|uniref:TonB-dependent receptor n=1 Tax=Pedobacter sp. BS3 TaxID=2567937 RepID=UPI0011EC7D1A|nr:TonB-dependent receptor [Pedobacter sp. BS3]TZF84699.1 TonB-dependent receptor [Pedobacter sp. BS3]